LATVKAIPKRHAEARAIEMTMTMIAAVRAAAAGDVARTMTTMIVAHVVVVVGSPLMEAVKATEGSFVS
jgi:hypothetical protein